MESYSIIIPVYNEGEAIGGVLKRLLTLSRSNKLDLEIIVVDDGSTDHTVSESMPFVQGSNSNQILTSVRAGVKLRSVEQYPVRLVTNLQNFGYGLSLKKGIETSSHENIIIIDGDGSYPVEEIPKLIGIYEQGYDMVVGARQGKHYWGSFLKYPARLVFLWLAEFVAGRRIPDVNSGLRIFKKEIYLKYASTLCSGFSFTTTLTLALLSNYHSVYYQPIGYYRRIGDSKVRYIRDTLRTGQILVESILLYNPLKLYLLLGIGVVVAGGLSVMASFFLDRFVVGIAFSGITACIAIFGIGLGVFRISRK